MYDTQISFTFIFAYECLYGAKGYGSTVLLQEFDL